MIHLFNQNVATEGFLEGLDTPQWVIVPPCIPYIEDECPTGDMSFFLIDSEMFMGSPTSMRLL